MIWGLAVLSRESVPILPQICFSVLRIEVLAGADSIDVMCKIGQKRPISHLHFNA